MSQMPIIDSNGLYHTNANSLTPVQSAHPVYKARIALALPIGQWLYAPTSGQNFANYQNAKATPAKIAEFEKNVKLYLKPYGAAVTAQFLGRGSLEIDFTIPQSPSTSS